jgi:hypothetical protein
LVDEFALCLGDVGEELKHGVFQKHQNQL